jgi:hypothetical protein
LVKLVVRRWSGIFLFSGILIITLLKGIELFSAEKIGSSTKKEISFSRDIQPILTKSCAVPECHVGPKPAKGMILTEDQAYNNLVNVKSKESPRQMRVAPGDLKKSYLYDKLTGNHNDGDRMPPKKRLPKESIELFKVWILAGAPDDSPAVARDSASTKSAPAKSGGSN